MAEQNQSRFFTHCLISERGSQISFSMADLISGDKINQIMDAFNSLADRNGIVLTRRLGDLMKALGENPTKEEVQGRLVKYLLYRN